MGDTATAKGKAMSAGKCTWTYEDDGDFDCYQYSCVDAGRFSFTDGAGLKDDPDFKYCPYCGGEIVAVYQTPKPEADDE